MSDGRLGIVASAVFLLALGIATLVGYKARYLGLVDVPNQRSSHSAPTPRGGGVGIFIAAMTGIWFWSRTIQLDSSWRNALIGAAAVAIIGLWDDVRSVSPRWRFSVHLVSAVLLASALPANFGFEIAGTLVTGLPAFVLASIGVIGSINMFNFMDGIDGLAASEAVFVTGGAALILILSGHGHTPVVAVCVLIAAASAGFLLVNWDPARIFMGDVGSGFLGYSIAAIALLSMAEQVMSVWTWIILGGVFLADTVVTFFRRLCRGENVTSAHRMHAYQRLVRRWSSHRKVSILATATNCFWILPLAAVSIARPSYAPFIAAIAVIPIGAAAMRLGAGLPD